MEWLSNLTNGENGSAINLVLITLAIAILLIVIVWIFRKMTGSAARRAMRSRVPRLSITDSTTVDEKRYLVMVRRDNVEHLLLIGGANDLVVESNIVRAQTAQKPVANARTEATQAAAMEQPATESETSITAPVAGAAAIANSVSELASSATEAVAEKANDVVETVTETLSDTASDVTDTVANITETVSTEVETPVDIEIPEVATAEATVEVVEDVEIPEMDLESTISAQLDDALSGEALDIAPNEASVEISNTANEPQSGNDDEMQRLLNELSGEVKEPAQ